MTVLVDENVRQIRKSPIRVYLVLLGDEYDAVNDGRAKLIVDGKSVDLFSTVHEGSVVNLLAI